MLKFYISTFVVETNFISFLSKETIIFSWCSANKYPRGYFLLLFVFKSCQGQLYAFNMIIECHVRSDLQTQEPIKLLFKIFTSYDKYILLACLCNFSL